MYSVAVHQAQHKICIICIVFCSLWLEYNNFRKIKLAYQTHQHYFIHVEGFEHTKVIIMLQQKYYTQKSGYFCAITCFSVQKPSVLDNVSVK